MKKSQLKKLNKIIKDFEFDLFEKYEVYLLNNQDLKTRIVSYFHSTHITLLGYYYDFSVDKFYIFYKYSLRENYMVFFESFEYEIQVQGD